MVSTIKNAALALEGAAIGAGPALRNLSRGLREKHAVCTVESTLEVTSGCSSYVYYAGKGVYNLAPVAHVFSSHLPSFLVALEITMDSLPVSATLGSVGIAINAFRLGKESLSLYRQNKFLSIFENHAWTGARIQEVVQEAIQNFENPQFREKLPPQLRGITKKRLKRLLAKIEAGDDKVVKKIEIFAKWIGLLRGLEAIKNLPEVELERALPEWLYQHVTHQGGKIYLNNLLDRVSNGDRSGVDEASKLLNDMKSYATKKRIVPILKIISAVISAISCIVFFVACPWAIGVMFLVLIVIFSGAAYMVNSGYVENRAEGFSLKLCVPEFLRDLGAAVWNSPEKIKAWIHVKKPKPLSYHPFFDRGIEIARKSKRSISAERELRRTRLAARGVFLSNSTAA
jgi:hypothetical protein